jgi:hypothetical protein
MNFIKQFNTFFENLLTEPLSSNAVYLYFTLFYINNKCNWKREFTVANSTLMGLTGFDKNKIDRSRNELKQKGYINYQNGKNQFQAGTYEILNFDTASDTTFNTALDTASDTAHEDINKQNKTKHNNTSSKNDDAKKELKKHFELIWDIYPHKLGKAKAEEYFLKWVKGRKINGTTIKLTDKQMYLAVKKYKKECEDKQIEQQYIKYGDTFFNKAILDYVENG